MERPHGSEGKRDAMTLICPVCSQAIPRSRGTSEDDALLAHFIASHRVRVKHGNAYTCLCGEQFRTLAELADHRQDRNAKVCLAEAFLNTMSDGS